MVTAIVTDDNKTGGSANGGCIRVANCAVNDVTEDGFTKDNVTAGNSAMGDSGNGGRVATRGVVLAYHAENNVVVGGCSAGGGTRGGWRRDRKDAWGKIALGKAHYLITQASCLKRTFSFSLSSRRRVRSRRATITLAAGAPLYPSLSCRRRGRGRNRGDPRHPRPCLRPFPVAVAISQSLNVVWY